MAAGNFPFSTGGDDPNHKKQGYRNDHGGGIKFGSNPLAAKLGRINGKAVSKGNSKSAHYRNAISRSMEKKRSMVNGQGGKDKFKGM